MSKNPFNMFENENYLNFMKGFNLTDKSPLNIFKKNYDTTINLYESIIEGTASFVKQNNDFIQKISSLISELSSDPSLDHTKKQEKIKKILDEFQKHNNKFLEYTNNTQENTMVTVKKYSNDIVKQFETLFTPQSKSNTT